MDKRSPKRRRTSDNARDSRTGGGDDQDDTQTTPWSRRRRPSIASPTRASMMRNNPQASDRRGEAAGAGAGAGAQSSRASEPSNNRAPGQQQQQQTAQLQQQRLGRGGILAPSGQQQQPTQLRQQRLQPQPQPQQQQQQRAPSQTARPRAGTLRNPGQDDTSGEFVPRNPRPAPVTGIAFPQPPEPELPPTRHDPVSSSPPKGIHNSPSRWKSRAKQKSSPLKQPPMRPGQDDEPEPEPVPTPQALQRRPNPPALAAPVDEPSGRDGLPDPARNVQLQDPDKLKERNALRQEFAQLQRDLEMATRENARLLRTQTTGRYVEPANKDQILELLQRSLIPADPLALPPQSQQLMMAAMNPVGLLPFSKPVASLVPDRDEDDDGGKKIKSHHPIEMSAEDELPFLKLFSPFDVSSSIAALAATREHPFRQRRLLSLRARDQTFHACVEMIVNPMTLAILELRVAALEPAARAELQPLVDTICEGRCNRSMQRNVGLLVWAMGEWHRIAVERAHVWARLDEEVLGKGGAAQAAAVQRRRARQGGDRDGDDGAAADSRRPRAFLRAADVRYLMGRQAYDLPMETSASGRGRQHAHIRLEWKIGFDWTGEAESTLVALFGVPGKWRRVDQRGSLGKLGRLFQDLVRSGQDIDVAARNVAALLVGSGDE